MRNFIILISLILLSGCLTDPFSSFEEIESISEPVRIDRQILSFEDFEGISAGDNNSITPLGVVTDYTVSEDPVTGNSFLTGKGEGSIIVPEVELSSIDSFTFTCWMRTYSNNFERILSQTVNGADSARIIITNDRISVGVNSLNDSAPLMGLLFNGEWAMLTVTSASVNVEVPSSGSLIYINGDLITSSSAGLLKFEQGPVLKLMDRFTGDFDGLKIFDTKLNEAEIRDLYLQSRSRYPEKQEEAIVPDGLASYYRFDDGDGSLDAVSRLNGTFSGTPTFGEDVSIASGRSLSFDNTSGNRSVLEISCSLFDNVNGFSLSFWAKSTAAVYSPMIIQGPNLFAGTHLVSFNNGEVFAGNTEYCFTCPPNAEVYNDGEWHHFTITCFSINTSAPNIPMTLYVDGAFEGQSPNSEINFLSDHKLIIGGDGSGTSFTGSIDNIRLYNRPISEEEAREIFNSGS
ncbi:LamG domain-containing protein [Neolewinella persica]|uniref:LamG domain-containing protein n=1 Tax=Neolewinella persica TaxID=70998 RepID=UPI00035F4A9C|nr:LamG-like jellyroll fold domain-containing protein [Neolewinella persica]